MPGLVPGIHVFRYSKFQGPDGRDRPGHDSGEAKRCEVPTVGWVERKRNPSLRGRWWVSLTLNPPYEAKRIPAGACAREGGNERSDWQVRATHCKACMNNDNARTVNVAKQTPKERHAPLHLHCLRNAISGKRKSTSAMRHLRRRATIRAAARTDVDDIRDTVAKPYERLP